jgi:membrane protein YqaA with SNARE-associated domain
VTQTLLGALGIYGGTLVACFVAGIVQLINTEAILLGVSIWLVDDPVQLPFVALCAAVGQMIANVMFFYMGRGAGSLPRVEAKLARARAKIASWRQRPNLVLVAAAIVGLPPLVLVAVAAGGLGIGVKKFVAIGFGGRWLRFAIVVAIPWLPLLRR